jgi:hypothetical protein
MQVVDIHHCGGGYFDFSRANIVNYTKGGLLA